MDGVPRTGVTRPNQLPYRHWAYEQQTSPGIGWGIPPQLAGRFLAWQDTDDEVNPLAENDGATMPVIGRLRASKNLIFTQLAGLRRSLARMIGNLKIGDIDKMERFRIDRRLREDRRVAHDMDYFLNDGVERRGLKERRRKAERRGGWIRVNKWTSVCLDLIKSAKI